MSSSQNQEHLGRNWKPPAPKSDRDFDGELQKKMGEAGLGIFTAMRAVAVQDQQRMLAQHAKRVCEDHRIQQMAAGYRDKSDGIECPESGEELMGDISVAGDSYNYVMPDNSTKSQGNNWVKPALIAAGAALIPAAMILGYLLGDKPENLPADTNTDTISTVRIVE